MNIVNTYHMAYPSLVQNAAMLAVLTQDGAGQYGVYTGIVRLNSSDENYAEQRKIAADWVAGHGQKMTYENSKAYFRGIPKEKYRD